MAEKWEKDYQDFLLEKAIQELRTTITPDKFMIFDLYVRQGRSPVDVANALRISIGQVYLTRTRVLKRLNEIIERLQTEID